VPAEVPDTSPAQDAESPTRPSPDLTAQWPTRAADAVDLVVDTIRDRAVRPILVGARAVVFGLLVITLGVVLLVVLSVSVVRLLDVYVFPGRVWASYTVLGLIFCAGGAVSWWYRTPHGAQDDASGL
jgi:hypothetical protein